MGWFGGKTPLFSETSISAHWSAKWHQHISPNKLRHQRPQLLQSFSAKVLEHSQVNISLSCDSIRYICIYHYSLVKVCPWPKYSRHRCDVEWCQFRVRRLMYLQIGGFVWINFFGESKKNNLIYWSGHRFRSAHYDSLRLPKSRPGQIELHENFDTNRHFWGWFSFFPRDMWWFPGGYTHILLPVWDIPFLFGNFEPLNPPNQTEGISTKNPRYPHARNVEGRHGWWGGVRCCYTLWKPTWQAGTSHYLKMYFPIETWGMFFQCHVDVFQGCKFPGKFLEWWKILIWSSGPLDDGF